MRKLFYYTKLVILVTKITEDSDSLKVVLFFSSTTEQKVTFDDIIPNRRNNVIKIANRLKYVLQQNNILYNTKT